LLNLFHQKALSYVVGKLKEISDIPRVKQSIQYAKDFKQKVKAKATEAAKVVYENLPSKKVGLALVATTAVLAGAAYYQMSKNPLSEVLDGKQFLVVHDNKPKNDAKAGRFLPRLALIDEKKGYTEVKIPENSPLRASNDLESLIKRPDGSFIACQSDGKACFQFRLRQDEDKAPVADVFRTFSLGTPKGEYTNIEGVAISPDSSKIYWSHRGNPDKNSEVPFDEQTHLTHIFSAPYSDIATRFTPKVAAIIDTPFAEKRVELRSHADHIVTPQGEHLLVAAADPEDTGTKDFPPFSIVHNDKDQCLNLVEGDKIEGMYLDPKTNNLYLGSDNEAEGARVCKVALGSPDAPRCATVLKGQEYGISGMVQV